jgi:transcriptional regulator with XRE-family HTH domain
MREARFRRGLRQTDVARAVGYSQGYISLIEADRLADTAGAAVLKVRLARLFSMNVSELFPDAGGEAER